MDFGALPPEINSTRMYSGPGSAPIHAASAAWNLLATELVSAASLYQSTIDVLTDDEWLGPTSASMAAAVDPYITWMNTAGAQAEQTAVQASSAASAYEAAFAMTVPPVEVAANRAQLMALIASNVLGQNTPAIAATEALYMEMWFQDGLTMDTYALTSQQAVVLPQQTPAPTTSDGGTSANAAAAAQSTSSTGTNLATALQNLFPSLTGNSSTTGSNGLSSAASTLGVPAATQSAATTAATGVADTATGSILPVQAAYYLTMFASMPAKMLISMSNSMSASQAMQAGQQAMLADVTSILDSKMKAMMASISGQMRGFGSAISAQLASAGKLGGLSVPNGWAQAAPEMVRAAPILPANSLAAPNVSAATPNSPFTQALMGAMNGRGMGTQAAKTASVKVETRTPAGG